MITPYTSPGLIQDSLSGPGPSPRAQARARAQDPGPATSLHFLAVMGMALRPWHTHTINETARGAARCTLLSRNYFDGRCPQAGPAHMLVQPADMNPKHMSNPKYMSNQHICWFDVKGLQNQHICWFCKPFRTHNTCQTHSGSLFLQRKQLW